MIYEYCKMAEVEISRELFNKLGSAENSIAGNTMISGHLH